jgi:hypothetical protein
LRYEDLIADPEGQLRRLYEHLGLGGFEQYRPRLRRYLADHADYETNTYELTAEQRAIVTERWGEVIHRYRYCQASTASRLSSACRRDHHPLGLRADSDGISDRRSRV